MTGDEPRAPTPEESREARERLGDRIRTTPVWSWRGREIEARVAPGTEVVVKLELLQVGGTFKPRGALVNLLSLDAAGRDRGVTAVSAGNHAIAIALAAKAVGTTAKVVMPSNADPYRVEGCRDFGAEVVLTDDVHAAFDEVERIREEEGRTFVHPFEGERTVLGTSTVGLEWMEQSPDLAAVILPIGGGGLAAGMSSAIKQMRPTIRIYGVEPEGADTMRRSFESGRPEAIDEVRTIADSLGAPHASPRSFGLCRRFVDELVTVSDDELVDAMRLIHAGLKFAVEPACAAATAALVGPLKDELAGERVGVLFCGSNISPAKFCELVGR